MSATDKSEICSYVAIISVNIPDFIIKISQVIIEKADNFLIINQLYRLTTELCTQNAIMVSG
jgi:hypothetical protein